MSSIVPDPHLHERLFNLEKDLNNGSASKKRDLSPLFPQENPLNDQKNESSTVICDDVIKLSNQTSRYTSKINEVGQRILQRLKKQPRIDDGGLPVAIEIAEKLKSNHSRISPYIREPLENLSKINKGNFPEDRFISLVSYERFVANLKHSFSRFLQSLEKLPEDERQYVIIGDRPEKSANWAVSHLLGLMGNHPPEDIFHTDESLVIFLQENQIKEQPKKIHVVYVDDASFSGQQIRDRLNWLGGLTRPRRALFTNTDFHFCIPYMSNAAKNMIRAYARLAVGKTPQFYTEHLMFSHGELGKLGYLGQTKFKRPHVEKLLRISPLQGDQYQTINEQLKAIKSNIFKKNSDTHLFDKKNLSNLQELIEHVAPFADQENVKQFIADLTEVIEGVERFGEDPDLTQAHMKRLEADGIDLDKTTGLWMAHKSADGVSVRNEPLLNATGGKKAIEPYKNDDYLLPHNSSSSPVKKRQEQIERLQLEFPDIVANWESETRGKGLDALQVVQSNRGYFLLSDAYVPTPSNRGNAEKLFIMVNDLEIPFGGEKGAYQLKLEENMNFNIRTSSGHFYSFKFEHGRITLLTHHESQATS